MQAKNLQQILNVKNFLANVTLMVKDVSIKTIHVRTLLLKANALKIMQEIFAYGFNNNVLIFHNALKFKVHLMINVNNIQINVLVMVLLVYLFHNVLNILIKLVAHLVLMDNVDGLIILVLPLKNALI